MKKKDTLLYIFLQAALVGSATAGLLCLFKYVSKYVIATGLGLYEVLRAHLWAVLPAAAVLLGLAVLSAYIYHRIPELKGGGIPISICAIKGLTAFNGFKNLIGVFCLSLCSFFIGLPLGNEGPSVQMGAAVGEIVNRLFGKKERAMALTGGAGSGFCVATGAPISGILFAVEEAHKKVSGKILAFSAVSVLFATVVNELLAPMLGVSKGLFAPMSLPSLGVGELWLPLLVGVAVGLFATLFLKYYRLLDTLINRVTARAPRYVRLFVIFLLTMVAGLYCGEMISTGHDLFEVLTEGHTALWLLLLILAVRTTLTLSANTAGATGGIFLPLLVLGGTTAAAVAEVAVLLGMNEVYYPVAVMLGVVGCVAGMMKMPLTAPVFALEALSLQGNLLPVMITTVIAFIIPELCGVDSIVETIVHRKERTHQHKESAAPVEAL